MKYVRTRAYPLHDLDYFIKHGCEVSSMDEIIDSLEDLSDSELEDFLGYPDEYSEIK